MAIRYSKELKATLVSLHVEQGISFKDLSEEYGPSVDSIRNWVKISQPIVIENGDVITLAEYNDLKKKFKRLEENYAILKRAVVLLAKN